MNLLLILLAFSGTADAAKKPFTVVIDPGHGGSDYGAVYQKGRTRIEEKNITLWLSREVAQQLKSKGIKVHLTREKDQEVPLPERTAFANRMKADAFISIHLNAFTDHTHPPEGIETYILNNTTNESSLRLAALENKHDLLKGSIAKLSQQAEVNLIVKDLLLDANLVESQKLACEVQSSLVSATSRNKVERQHRDRGVRQALFYVLLGADMPSILLEAGFIHHPKDRSWVLTRAGRQKMAKAMAQAILDFKNSKTSSRNLASCQIH